MDHYQLRLPLKFGVLGLSKSLSRGLQAALNGLGLRWRPDNPLTLPQAVQGVLQRHLVAYDTCGTSCICDESVQAVPWNLDPDPLLTSSDPTLLGEVLRVQFRFSAEEFYRFTAFLARVAASASTVAEDRALLAQETLEKSVFTALSPYLFEAPLCHHRALCKDATPLDLWGANYDLDQSKLR